MVYNMCICRSVRFSMVVLCIYVGQFGYQWWLYAYVSISSALNGGYLCICRSVRLSMVIICVYVDQFDSQWWLYTYMSISSALNGGYMCICRSVRLSMVERSTQYNLRKSLSSVTYRYLEVDGNLWGVLC